MTPAHGSASARRQSRRQSDDAARLLGALARQGRLLKATDDDYELVAADGTAATVVVSAALVGKMLGNDWLREDGPGGLIATDGGLAWLRRRAATGDPWRSQHLATKTTRLDEDGQDGATVSLVINESPLAWLRSRRGADGKPLVSETQFRAGERLRSEFERGRMSPGVTADWTKAALGRGRRGPGGGPGDLLDSAIAARQRVAAAMHALGPDLGALLLDVCCFLVGLEDAERKRRWPRRSAKVVLGIALDRLASHYGLAEAAHGADRSGRIEHWGAEDFRPSLDEPVSGSGRGGAG